jgi:hypothetical protein
MAGVIASTYVGGFNSRSFGEDLRTLDEDLSLTRGRES